MITQATTKDIPEICALYNHYVSTSTAIFQDHNYTEADIETTISECQNEGWPFFIARNEALLGFALYRQFRRGTGYAKTMESSVYLDPKARGRGVGRQLLEELIRFARSRNVHSLIGGITADNQGSIAFHRRLGFRIVGDLPEAGYKFGKYHDLVFMQLILD